ncbi:MAG: transposase [bacterium]|jgi:transposase|nr:transposase [candidate division KSB1 bacterium]MDH7561536.1 transposase [bacterium]
MPWTRSDGTRSRPPQEAHRLRKSNPQLLEGTRYLWLKNPAQLTPPERQRLGYLEGLNLQISRAYLLKQQLRHLWEKRTRPEATAFLGHWVSMAMESQLRPMHEFASLRRGHRDGVRVLRFPLTAALQSQ